LKKRKKNGISDNRARKKTQGRPAPAETEGNENGKKKGR